MVENDTIAAIATPPGQGGVGIIRVSGPLAPRIAEQVTGALPPPRHARFSPFHDGKGVLIDEGITLWFQAPHSFTGEEVVELQGHGGPVVLDLLLRRVLECGARVARAGEFSQRAFLNGRLDLTQAEAIADLIESATAGAARLAARSLAGGFSERIHVLVERLIQLRMFIEAAIDFPEEELDLLGAGQIASEIAALKDALDGLQRSARTGQLLRDGITLVIAGRPNAGKSSLLNALADRDTAIVTEIPGTTRDLLREWIQIDGLPIHLIDTAGLRESGDPVEREGIRRATAAISEADGVLLVFDDRHQEHIGLLDGIALPPGVPVIEIRNKIDLTGHAAGLRESEGRTEIALSARQGDGVQLLRNHLRHLAGLGDAQEGEFIARRRHLDALHRTRAHLQAAAGESATGRSWELVAEDLRQAQQTLGEITGEFGSDELLGRIFSSFCIGK